MKAALLNADRDELFLMLQGIGNLTTPHSLLAREREREIYDVYIVIGRACVKWKNYAASGR